MLLFNMTAIHGFVPDDFGAGVMVGYQLLKTLQEILLMWIITAVLRLVL